MFRAFLFYFRVLLVSSYYIISVLSVYPYYIDTISMQYSFQYIPFVAQAMQKKVMAEGEKEQEHEIQTALEQKHDAQYKSLEAAIKGVASTHPPAAPQPQSVPDVSVLEDGRAEGDDRVPGDTPSYRLSTGASRAKRQSEAASESNKKKKSDNNTTGPMGRSRK